MKERNGNTIEFLGIWQQPYNPRSKPLEFDRFRGQAGICRFAPSPKKFAIEAGHIKRKGPNAGNKFAEYLSYWA